ncbi:response regulator transcription factor [Paraburkholderia aspalathi]|uniref:Two-component system, OmpR family, response regulator n=1 Tax=Paraburkholderia aspalathi TaxID=1324617 RepID=A0A1I7B5N8_9BURK|nr:response regulator transcription factor [Paraburkholderia aspalathi]SFT82471.1 two-component system, OmpR family, response regulator [Paraburkholderia aspalathi]
MKVASGRHRAPGQPPRVLVIEDDGVTASDIRCTLEAEGFEVAVLDNGADAIARVLNDAFDAITLDRMLPDADGTTVVRALRDAGCLIPVLMISALSDVDERMRGLRAGGDDYLVKPYHRGELAVRLQALLRRSAHSASRSATTRGVDNLELDLLARVARRGGRTIELAPAEFRLLDFLMEHAGKVLSRPLIFEAVWEYRFDPGTNIIEVHIARLRRKLALPGELQLIHTVRNEGYRIG